jgi:hypothetical protein
MPSKKRYGVRSTLPGAPDEPHEVPGLQMLVHPTTVTPELDDDQEQQVRDLIKQGADLELVDLDKPERPAPGHGVRVKRPVTEPQPDEAAAGHSEDRPTEAAVAAAEDEERS